MRPDSHQWLATKGQGDKAELAIAEWFRTRGWEPFKSLGRADVDLLLQCFVEVKRDLQAEKTGNVAIEVAYRQQASGILTSPANYWSIVVGAEALVIKTADLRAFALSERFRESPAGDGRLATVRLIPLEKLRGLKGVQHVQLGGLQP